MNSLPKTFEVRDEPWGWSLWGPDLKVKTKTVCYGASVRSKDQTSHNFSGKNFPGHG